MNIAPVLILVAAATATDLQHVLDRVRNAQDVPGVSAVAIAQNSVIFAGGSGLANLETGEPMTADTVLYMGSLTKVLTAILALQLVETGQMALDDPVPGIAVEPEGQKATVRIVHLLSHSSGLEREGDFGYWFSADFPDASELENYLSRTRLRFPPGTGFHYSNVGYAAVGRAIEVAGRETYTHALRTRVFDPLGMNASGADPLGEGVATGYTPPGRIIPSEERPFAGVGRQVGNRHMRVYHDARAMGPAFGVYTSVRDLGRLVLFLLGQGDQVLSVESRARLHEPQASGWGLGLKIQKAEGRSISRHTGWFAAHRSHLLVDVDLGIGVAVQANADNASPDRIADALYAAVLAEQPRP